MQMDLCYLLCHVQSPIALYTEFNAEYDQQVMFAVSCWQHFATMSSAHYCQVMSTKDVCRLFITLSDGWHAMAKFSKSIGT